MAEVSLRLDHLQELAQQVGALQQDEACGSVAWRQEHEGRVVAASRRLEALESFVGGAGFQELQKSWDVLKPSLAEHDRSARVVMRDILPRLGSLADAQDELCEFVSSLA